MKNSVVQMNPEAGNLKYDYSDLDRFLRTFDKKHLSRCYNHLVYAFTDILAVLYNLEDEAPGGLKLEQGATDHIKYLGEVFQILEDLPENEN